MNSRLGKVVAWLLVLTVLGLTRWACLRAADDMWTVVRGYPYMSSDPEGRMEFALSRVKVLQVLVTPIGVRHYLSISNVSLGAPSNRCTPADRQSSRYLEYVKQLEQSGSISATEAVALRSGDLEDYQPIATGILAHAAVVVGLITLMVLQCRAGRGHTQTP